MKLQTKINIRFLTVTFLVFSVAGVLFYFSLNHVLDHNILEMLESRKAYIVLSLRQNPPTVDSMESPDKSILIRQINSSRAYTRFSDTIALDQEEKELIPFRKLTFTIHSGNKYYEVALMQSLLESEDLQIIILTFMAVLFGIVLAALFIMNHWLSNKAWAPFFKSLSVLSNWKISENQLVSFGRTGIYEFDQLNGILEEMMRKIQMDFVNLKEFTENASHEIQTPLAIIKSKLEMALQDKTLSAAQYQRIRSAFESTIRLSKLNEALLVLSKIENRQFVETAAIDIGRLVQSRLEYLEELFAMKKIEVIVGLDYHVVFLMNPALADLLTNNLLSNALKHNVEKGKIVISSEDQGITISNSSQQGELDVSRMFIRFSKQTNNSESNGLGLAIVHEICNTYHLKVHYNYSNDMHHFTIKAKS